MRRLQLSIWSGHSSWLDRRKPETPRVIGGNASVTRKARLVRFFLWIIRMSIFAMRIRLPDFDDPVRHWFAIAIENAARNFNAFTGNAWSRQIVPIEPGETDAEKWTD